MQNKDRHRRLSRPAGRGKTDFVATAKAAIFTLNKSWYKSLCNLEGDDKMNFDSACLWILSRLFQNLYFNRKHVLSSYHHRLYKMMKERNCTAWKVVIDKLPTCLRMKDAPVGLFIRCFSDILLDGCMPQCPQGCQKKELKE